ncbi:unnamed protein product [Euphydryas editha]|uniref:FLYWCH-type domain-containing protein n=1 Tax=Euphydryas editha TaxID=104508 RepID=A0AAU9TFV8_EUPED|nr:unnamed protein product [Euphydryas editha]
MGGYTFAQMHSQKHWYCSQKRKGCKAKVKLNEDGILVSALTEHCHSPPQIHVTNSGHYLVLRNVNHELVFLPSNRGKGVILLYKGYTFAHMTNKTRWYCSKKSAGCKARLITTHDGALMHVTEAYHNHPPPSLYRTNDGKIIKL